MNAGMLNRDIAIQTKAAGVDEYNEASGAWSDSILTKASIDTKGGREFMAAQRVNAETTAAITIRYRSDVTTAHRVRYGTRYYEVLALVDWMEGREWLTLSCKEVV